MSDDEGESIHAVKRCRPMSTAPKNGTLLRLRMDYSGEEESNALWDTAQFAWTVGFNQFEDTEVDEWQFAGWDWNGDEFEKGRGGVPVGWLPFFHDAVDVSAEKALKSLEEADMALREQSDVQGMAVRCVAQGIISAYETITAQAALIEALRSATPSPSPGPSFLAQPGDSVGENRD